MLWRIKCGSVSITGTSLWDFINNTRMPYILVSRVFFDRKLRAYRLVEFKVEALIIMTERGTVQKARIR